MEEIELLINEFKEAAMAHGAESSQYSVLGGGFEPEKTQAVLDEKEQNLLEYVYKYVYNRSMEDKLDDLIDEFLDAAGIEKPKSLGLSFDTNIRHWEREELEDLIKEFMKFIQDRRTD